MSDKLAIVQREAQSRSAIALALEELDALPIAEATRAVYGLPRHPVAHLLLGLAEGSRPTMLGALHSLARLASRGALGAWSLPWWQLTAAETQQFRARVVAQYMPSTAKKIMVALRQVLRACERPELMTPDELARAALRQGARRE